MLAAFLALIGTTTAHADPPKPDVTATVRVPAGPFVLEQLVPIELTITNNSTVEATGVSGYLDHLSGSRFGLYGDGWDGLVPPWEQPTVSLAPGASKSISLKGRVYEYRGNSKFKLRVNAKDDIDPDNGVVAVELPMLAPTKTGRVGGVLWGDANGNGVQDAGEGLAGATAFVWGPGRYRETITDADGRFAFAELEVAVWEVNFAGLPGGWVIGYDDEQLPIDGSDSTSDLRYQAVRPPN